jgi:hypothetical protein
MPYKDKSKQKAAIAAAQKKHRDDCREKGVCPCCGNPLPKKDDRGRFIK